ncbi:PhoD-like phosphatase N-terminal domain-containing protein, partial [Saccharopolyspora shandongensis]|uniref:PhoD-like phosphatase N-terminal domain-containing protein n=1 Tax=Saccharopolyspora shandongensis TaxID=418495 RepID=UPI003437D60D
MSENPGPSQATPSRRKVLLAGTAALGAAALGSTGLGAVASASPGAGVRPIRSPFSLGVASGDPLPSGVVLWTRLAPNPLAEDGLGGMSDRIVPVQWQVATDEHFRHVVADGIEMARPESAHSVHVELDRLEPATDYFYRFRVDGELSPV